MDVGPTLQLRLEGLYCPAGDFFLDPWAPVERAVISHAHADHARPGSASYLTTKAGETVLRARLGPDARIDTAEYGEILHREGVRLSLHPAGHVLGSAQVRLEAKGHVTVFTGDWKRDADPTCAPFEPLRCHTFITESTFGLPIYRWQPADRLIAEIRAWWQANAAAGKASLLLAYALGKAQRILAALGSDVGPIYTHGAVEKINAAYRAAGISLPQSRYVAEAPKGTDWSGALIVAPPSAHGTVWARRFGQASTAFASGWMQIRGTRRRRAVDRGFALSDHADWPALLDAVRDTGAEQVWVTHGYTAVMVRWLQEHGVNAHALPTRFEGEVDEGGADEPPPLPAEEANP